MASVNVIPGSSSELSVQVAFSSEGKQFTRLENLEYWIFSKESSLIEEPQRGEKFGSKGL